MKRFSTNPKYNATMCEIYDDLLTMCDTETESRREIARYRKEFPRELGYNLAQYGNMLIYFDDVRAMFSRCGYSVNTLRRLSDSRLWDIYLARVGAVVRAAF